MRGMSSMTPEQQTKMKEAGGSFGGKNPAEMTPEERTAAFAKMRAEMEKAGVSMPARGERKGGGETKKGGESKEGDTAVAGGERRGRRGGEGGGPVAFGGMRGAGGAGGYGGFSQKELDTAQLPPPPEESANQLDVLLRPGLLADVEIIVEKIPNAIYIPAQAIFEREGKSVVYVKQGTKFEMREVKPLRRSESLMIISTGLKAGEEAPGCAGSRAASDKKKNGGGWARHADGHGRVMDRARFHMALRRYS
jgi:hypothetical protein